MRAIRVPVALPMEAPPADPVEVLSLPAGADLAQTFKDSAVRSLSQVVEVPSWPDAWAEIAKLLTERRYRSAICWDEDQFPETGLTSALRAASCCMASKGEWATADVGITGAVAGIAATGSLVLNSGPGRPRSASLLPQHHIAILPRSAIGATVEKWFEAAGAQLDQVANTFFITGPSRSGDIEMNVTLGVHGPGELTIIVGRDG
jgi:L-lactate dehydrogenase complex protein LldG